MGINDFVPSDDAKLNKLLLFTAEIDKMTSIYRRTMLLGGERHENDAEHSWHIAVMALLFKEYCLEEPSVERAIKMCVVHDLIEIYAGDTFAYDVQGNASKAAREEAAADRLFSQLPPEQGAEIRSLFDYLE